jgi:hypothetical protein
MNKVEKNKLKELIAASPTKRKRILTKQKKIWKSLINTAHNINIGNIPLNKKQLKICEHYKNTLLCLGHPNKKLSISNRRESIINQKGSGIFTALIPLIASLAATALQ